MRNVAVAIGNSADAALIPSALRLSEDPSPLVRGAAVWALSRLLPPGDIMPLAAERRVREANDDVREEWDAAMAVAPQSNGHRALSETSEGVLS